MLRQSGSRWDVLVAISAGGVAGSLARSGLAEALPAAGSQFPWATFVTNVSGCFLIGVLMVFVVDVWPPRRYVRPFLGVGLLGGYTTFSAYVVEGRALLLAGRELVAATYLLGSLAAGLAAVWLGVTMVRLLIRARRRDAACDNAAAAHDLKSR